MVLDGQITGPDGIGRCTVQLAAALRRASAEHGLSLHVEPAGGAPRYSLAESSHLIQAAQRHRADLLHLMDYRVPVPSAPLPLVATVHDLLRLRHPQHCYTDEAFTRRFGQDRMRLLQAATSALRGCAPWPPGTRRDPRSSHEEFYGRMTTHAAATAATVLTPTRVVAGHLEEAVGHRVPTRTAPWGTDHLPAHAPPKPGDTRQPRYLLYVGQARSHKGLPVLFEAYQRSSARRRGLTLALAGRDFTPGNPAVAGLVQQVVLLGEVTDTSLAALYSGAAAVVHLAEEEGFGFPPLEALSLGARVLCADVPALRETLGPHAVFTDQGDPRAVAADLDRLLDTEDTPAERWTRTDWASRYHWDRCARQVIDTYRAVLA
ncbi:MAG: glycosyltransferase [Micromonosporaceae bacterium]